MIVLLRSHEIEPRHSFRQWKNSAKDWTIRILFRLTQPERTWLLALSLPLCSTEKSKIRQIRIGCIVRPSRRAAVCMGTRSSRIDTRTCCNDSLGSGEADLIIDGQSSRLIGPAVVILPTQGGPRLHLLDRRGRTGGHPFESRLRQIAGAAEEIRRGFRRVRVVLFRDHSDIAGAIASDVAALSTEISGRRSLACHRGAADTDFDRPASPG
jgi:hypothetical protein